MFRQLNWNKNYFQNKNFNLKTTDGKEKGIFDAFVCYYPI